MIMFDSLSCATLNIPNFAIPQMQTTASLIITNLKHSCFCSSLPVRNIGIISDYMHIFNFLFNIPILPFQTDVLLLFSAEDMSRNVTLKILSKYLLDKC